MIISFIRYENTHSVPGINNRMVERKFVDFIKFIRLLVFYQKIGVNTIQTSRVSETRQVFQPDFRVVA
jgi:hypothetical protein